MHTSENQAKITLYYGGIYGAEGCGTFISRKFSPIPFFVPFFFFLCFSFVYSVKSVYICAYFKLRAPRSIFIQPLQNQRSRSEGYSLKTPTPQRLIYSAEKQIKW